MQTEGRPALLLAASSFGFTLASARRRLRAFSQGIHDTLHAVRNARGAEAIYHELSRLCDAELARRGTRRRHILRLVFDRLTLDQRPVSFTKPRR